MAEKKQDLIRMTREPTVWELLTGLPFLSSAYYIPQGHAQYCDTPDVLCQYMAPCLCSVTERICFGDKTTDELFTSVCISPWQTHQIADPKCSPPRFYRLWKLIEPANLTQMSFPAEIVNIQPRSDTLTVLDVGGRHWPMKLVLDVDTGGYTTVGEEWAEFVKAKALREGDRVVLLRILGSAITYFATSRSYSESMCRHNINSDAVSKAIGSLMQSKPVVVTYFPLDPKADFLVPPRDFRNSVGVNWTPGMRVRKVREYEGENHVGTITSTTFSNGNFSDVMRSLWRCHTVVWDEPHGFDRIHFSPWELIPSQEQPQQQPQPPHTLQLFPL